MWQLQPPPLPPPYEKIYPLFPSNRLLRVEVLSSLPFFKFGWRINPRPPCRKDEAGGAHCVKLRLTNWDLKLVSYYLQHTQNSWIQELPCISLVTCIIYWSLNDWQEGRRDSQTLPQNLYGKPWGWGKILPNSQKFTHLPNHENPP